MNAMPTSIAESTYKSNRLADLDRDLLLIALDSMIARFRAAAKAAGFRQDVIDLCIESELSLINRIQIGMTEKTALRETEGR